MDPDRVIIFDTTLRDGEQSPGISLNATEKLEIANQLARLGVDVIEAGFPITSPGDFEAVQEISRTVEGPVICGLSRTHKADIDAAWNAIKDSARPRIHTFISTSDIHIEHQLQSTREDVLGQARAAVAHARRHSAIRGSTRSALFCFNHPKSPIRRPLVVSGIRDCPRPVEFPCRSLPLSRVAAGCPFVWRQDFSANPRVRVRNPSSSRRQTAVADLRRPCR